MKTASDIDREAAGWIARRDAAGMSDTAQEQFRAWLDADVRHRASYLRLNAMWERTVIAARLRPLDGPVDPDLLAPSQPKTRRWYTAWVPAATIVLLVMGLGGWFILAAQRGEVYSTGVGHFERIRLHDGSTIELNTDSELRVRMTNEHRLVSLVRGEAHFKVAHDAGRPFDVEAGAAVVRAVGTAFSVRLRDRGKAEVLVTQGRVVIAPATPSLPEMSMEMPRISAGELASVAPRGVDVQPVQAAAITRRLAWTEGRLVFAEETLAEAIAEFNRYNRRQLVIIDPPLAALRVGGTFEATDTASFLAALDRLFGVQAQAVSADVMQLRAGWPEPSSESTDRR